MANRRISVSYGRTCQSAPFESIRLDVRIDKDIDDSANMGEEINKTTDSLQQYVKKKIKAILDNE